MFETPERITLQEMLVFADAEVSDIDVWETVLEQEGLPLYRKMALRRDMLRQIIKTLELLQKHEKDFVRLVKQAKKS